MNTLLQQFQNEMKIVTTRYTAATTENVEEFVKCEMYKMGCSPESYKITFRPVLAGTVAHINVYDLGHELINTLTFNKELYDTWKQHEKIFCRRSCWCAGIDVLSTLPDSEYLTKLHDFEKRLMTSKGYDVEAMLDKIKKSTYPEEDWRDFNKLRISIMKKDLPELFK